MKKILLAVSVVFLSLSFAAAQGTQDIDPRIKEVYKDHPEYMTPQHIVLYEENLSRVEIRQLQANEAGVFPLLSSVALKNKYNPSLTTDYGNNFHPGTFNALKYLFSFYPKTDETYHVDNTTYVVIIHAKQ